MSPLARKRVLITRTRAQSSTLAETLRAEGARPVLALFTAQSSYVRGRRVRVDLPERPITGTTAGLTADGYLLLDGDDGRRHTILAGGVRPES